jgi:anhydro-N-acetylmuramic acid kinase
MIYRTIGLMSGSSLDGLDIVFAELEESRGIWNYDFKAAKCIAYDAGRKQQLADAKNLDAYNYFLLHAEFGKFLAASVNSFIEENNLFHQVQLITSHGHTVFHAPQLGVTTQLGCGATLAALTGINVVCDLRNMDVALGGEGAPIVPLGEKLLFPGFDFYLNIGGIANISFHHDENFFAFDICAANRVLNMLAADAGKEYDEDGKMAAAGKITAVLLEQLNQQEYYRLPSPKSLSNNFGTEILYPLIQTFNINTNDALRTYAEHISMQIQLAVKNSIEENGMNQSAYKILITGGGALNGFLIELIKDKLSDAGVEVVIPQHNIIMYKEALIMGLLGVLRWREENTVLASVTGASRNSIGGAVWIGQEA